ncbi:Uma2 family endonuclease [Clostridium bowmanii]|uniref:Uma2 family endonuclease n=1 Tax=Clostridium bowmanii TaxID=132925 RepID=UPI001C0E700A|nr:Uma2 family endonuclease [Clostridium bowmanii]MBU3191528.1 Uma2 family endonuclease [Clostridium bowmanii]MCA1075873.1 Uma2 family endonuclease [Clostridium bowmanii]
MIPKENSIDYEEFERMDSGNESLEFINGIVYMQAAPSVAHQIVVTNLSTEFGNYFKGKDCRHFVSPFDVIFENEKEKSKGQPDLIVICDKSGLNEKNYVGVPTLAVEVLEPSTTSRDYIEKMDLYMRFGVQEYWIISPRSKTVEMFTLQQNGTYSEPRIYSKDDIVKSQIFEEFLISLQELFI